MQVSVREVSTIPTRSPPNMAPGRAHLARPHFPDPASALLFRMQEPSCLPPDGLPHPSPGYDTPPLPPTPRARSVRWSPFVLSRRVPLDSCTRHGRAARFCGTSTAPVLHGHRARRQCVFFFCFGVFSPAALSRPFRSRPRRGPRPLSPPFLAVPPAVSPTACPLELAFLPLW